MREPSTRVTCHLLNFFRRGLDSLVAARACEVVARTPFVTMAFIVDELAMVRETGVRRGAPPGQRWIRCREEPDKSGWHVCLQLASMGRLALSACADSDKDANLFLASERLP